MRRRLAALILCIMLVCQMVAPSAGAAGNVYFVAAGEYVLTLSDSTMPFWSNGYLYVSSSIFTGTTRDALGVSRGYDKNADAVVLYRSQDEALVFEMNKNYAWDAKDKVYYPGAIRRNGTEFVPAALIANYFGLQYSYMAVKNGHLIWIRKPESLQLPDSVFADAASIAMDDRYEEYQKSKGLSVPEEEPETPSAAITGKAVYLCLRADDNTGAMLDLLDRYHMQAAFYCDVEFMETQGALLRRMTATGHTIGILADAQDSEETVYEQVKQANELLERATCGRTRLVRLENADAQDEAELQTAGYHFRKEDLDRTRYPLRTAEHAESLQKRVAARSGSSVVWLGGSAGVIGLQAFLRIAAEEEGHCLALTETV